MLVKGLSLVLLLLQVNHYPILQTCMHANHKFGVHALYVHIDRLVTRELWTFKFQFMNRCGRKLHIMIESLKYPCQCICCCLQGLYPEQPCAST